MKSAGVEPFASAAKVTFWPFLICMHRSSRWKSVVFHSTTRLAPSALRSAKLVQPFNVAGPASASTRPLPPPSLPLLPLLPPSSVPVGVEVVPSEHANTAAAARTRPDEIEARRMLMFIAPVYSIG